MLQTPQPAKQSVQRHTKGTPKSAPQPKRKKLSQEIEEELSDAEFEVLQPVLCEHFLFMGDKLHSS